MPLMRTRSNAVPNPRFKPGPQLARRPGQLQPHKKTLRRAATWAITQARQLHSPPLKRLGKKVDSQPRL
jgi:hypothetical protein